MRKKEKLRVGGLELENGLEVHLSREQAAMRTERRGGEMLSWLAGEELLSRERMSLYCRTTLEGLEASWPDPMAWVASEMNLEVWGRMRKNSEDSFPRYDIQL